MTYEEFLKGFVLFRKAFPMLNIPDDSLEVWYALLQDVNFEVYQKALIHMLKTKSSWFPSDSFAGAILVAVEAIRPSLRYDMQVDEDRLLHDGSKPPQGGLNSAMMEEVERIRKAKQMGGGR